MRNAARKDNQVQSGDRSESYRAMLSNLASMIEQIEASKTLIKSIIAGEAATGDQEGAAGIAVLDDITPGFARANDALSTCGTVLAAALCLMQDTGNSAA
jgi:hypothetical protein